jgi:hypothetical protein
MGGTRILSTGRLIAILAMGMVFAFTEIGGLAYGQGVDGRAVPTATSEVSQGPLQVSHQTLSRPIRVSASLTHWLDRTYPYGSTQLGMREVHSGVEFVNPRYVSVLAADDGIVVFAGTDETVVFGPGPNYYGNLVVVDHGLSPAGDGNLFTLYAHLQDAQVRFGDLVQRGQSLGRVGDSGIAIGPHLHFEVRIGTDPRDFLTTVNPDLWIEPYPDYGTLVGRVIDEETGEVIPALVIFVQQGTHRRETYSYAADRVRSDPAWDENYVLGDLPAGPYEVFFSNQFGRKLVSQIVDIPPQGFVWVELVVPRDAIETIATPSD